ncbi:cation:proton antiporter [Rhodanobacter sp. T12-5]|uniref:cation:proton antiporter n=1 Tax=Rhodanobacter sp. T12-5 TaxID=2024611 RepID=UPI0011EDDE5D|nr:cation:proton antiporter [Rhodanobacter sp. T12-5]KAA0071678.1 cation:proton antiporter [Rhodanobacter sp. T12-5]
MGQALLPLQLMVILLVSRGLAWLLRWIGQPPVIGEMIAGLALGPMVFGALAPAWQGWLFAPASLPTLNGLSEIGLVLFMFIVGAELRLPDGVRQTLRAAGAVAGLAVALPIGLALLITPMLYTRYAPAGIAYWPFALFMAASLAVTAMPVLARILKDRQITRTPAGQLAMAAAAIADVLAWILLALTVALISAHGDWAPFWRSVTGVGAMLVLCFALLRPLLRRWLARHAANGRPDGSVLAVLLIGALGCAALTEWLHLHAVFGAFLFGLSLPRDDALLAGLIERLEHVAVIALMPVFFALTGLNTSIDALHHEALGAFALILAVAVLGKVIGGAVGARVGGYGWRESFAVGSLMNARGMVELIVLKIGLDAGVIGREMFTLLLLMAIVTTMLTTPMVLYFNRYRQAVAVIPQQPDAC